MRISFGRMVGMAINNYVNETATPPPADNCLCELELWPRPIPLSERLPAPNTQVLLCIGGVTWSQGRMSAHATPKIMLCGVDRWLPSRNITHWLPLPPKPGSGITGAREPHPTISKPISECEFTVGKWLTDWGFVEITDRKGIVTKERWDELDAWIKSINPSAATASTPARDNPDNSNAE